MHAAPHGLTPLVNAGKIDMHAARHWLVDRQAGQITPHAARRGLTHLVIDGMITLYAAQHRRLSSDASRLLYEWRHNGRHSHLPTDAATRRAAWRPVAPPIAN